MIIVTMMLSYPGFDEETTGRADRPNRPTMTTRRELLVKVDAPHNVTRNYNNIIKLQYNAFAL